jgi:hypothetical protein
MKRGNYDVLLLRPQDIADVVDMSKAIDLVERLSRGAGFPAKNRSIIPPSTPTIAALPDA